MRPIAHSEPVALTTRRLKATLSPLGATLSALEVDGFAIVAGPPAPDPGRGHHGAVLVPWPNRLAHGRYQYGSEHFQLPTNDSRYGHAIHGLAFERQWTPTRTSPSSVRFELRLGKDPGYPFGIVVSVEYSVSDTTLICRSSWKNQGRSTAPFGLGFHPYFRPGPSPISEWVLTVPLTDASTTDPETALPHAPSDIRGTELDFRRPAPIGEGRFSVAYRDLPGDSPKSILLSDPALHTVTVDRSVEFPWTQVFSGHLADQELNRRGVAIEPQTCPADAFSTGVDLLHLAPGEEGAGWWSVTVA